MAGKEIEYYFHKTNASIEFHVNGQQWWCPFECPKKRKVCVRKTFKVDMAGDIYGYKEKACQFLYSADQYQDTIDILCNA